MTRKSPEKTENDFWTDARVVELVKLYEDGLTFGQIGKHFGISRTAPAGKIWRMRKAGHDFAREYIPEAQRIAQRQKTAGRMLVSNRNVSRKAKSPTEPRQPRVPVDASLAKPWLERAFGECAYPILGEGADTLSCCRPCEDTYCAAHRAVMFVAPPCPPQRIAPWGARRAA